MNALQEFAERAKQLGCDLLSTEHEPCTEEKHKNQSCVTAEETRPLTRQEKAKGWARRPFNAYDHRRMCNGCAAYWFASMCHIVLQDMVCIRARLDAEAERQQQQQQASDSAV